MTVRLAAPRPPPNPLDTVRASREVLVLPRFRGHSRIARKCGRRVPWERRKRRSFSDEFKAETVKLVRDSGKSDRRRSRGSWT